MSKSFALINGDLVIGPGRDFELVSGQAKLLQDLKLWILEKIGTDSATPTYGSTLDGGSVNGVQIASFIGQMVNEESLMGIRAEIIRLLENYQSMQYEKIRSEVLLYNGQTTLESGEVIDSIESIRTTVVGGVVIIQVALNLISGDVVKLTLPIGASNG